MAKVIRVEPSRLDAAANKIEGQAAEYRKLYEQLYSEVNSMSSAWQGADNLAYTSQIEGFRDDFTAMYTLMTQYAEFLKNAAATYRQTQNEIVAQAKKLVN